MPIANNPAGRLYDILVRAKTGGIGGTVFSGWATVFGLAASSPEQEYEVYRKLFELHKLIDRAQHLLTKTIDAEEHDLYLGPYQKIRGFIPISQSTNTDFQQAINAISDGDMTVIRFGARELSKLSREPVVEEAELDNLKDEVERLLLEVVESDLSEELKALLLRQLRSIQRSILEYQINGIQRLREGLEDVVGALAMNQEMIKPEKKHRVVKLFLNAFLAYAALTTFAADTTTVIANVAPVVSLLTDGDPDVPAPPMATLPAANITEATDE